MLRKAAVLALSLWQLLGQQGGAKRMNDTTLEAEFLRATAQTDESYRAARQAILDRGASALAFLRASQSSPDWKVALTAAILVGWLQHRDLFDRCTEAIRGNFEGERPITGYFLPKQRIAVVRSLGNTVVPRLLEMVTKTHEFGSLEANTSIFGSLIALKDDRAVLPLIEVVNSRYPEQVRELAAGTLGELGDHRAAPSLRALLNNSDQPETLRAAAGMSLGLLGAKEAVADLRAVLTDQACGLELRKAAVRALDHMGDHQSAGAMLEAFARTDNLVFQLTLLSAVADLGSSVNVPAIQHIEHAQYDSSVQEAAREAREAIEERARTGKK
jgi:HEAT repeats